MDRIDVLKHFEKINNISVCEALHKNANEDCEGCPLQSNSNYGCLLDDIIERLENNRRLER